jgi:hypothetical protein
MKRNLDSCHRERARYRQTQRCHHRICAEVLGGVSEPGDQRGHLFVYIMPRKQSRILATSVTRAPRKRISEPVKAAGSICATRTGYKADQRACRALANLAVSGRLMLP